MHLSPTGPNSKNSKKICSVSILLSSENHVLHVSGSPWRIGGRKKTNTPIWRKVTLGVQGKNKKIWKILFLRCWFAEVFGLFYI